MRMIEKLREKKVLTRVVWALIGVAVAVISYLTGDADGSVTLAVVAVGGVEGINGHITGEPLKTDAARQVEEEFIKDPVDRLVVKFRQSAIPIDQMCRYAGSKPENGMRFEYYSVDTRPVADEVASENSAGYLTYSSWSVITSGATANQTGKIKVKNVGMWDASDLILVGSLGDAPATMSSGSATTTGRVPGYSPATGTINSTAQNATRFGSLILQVLKVEGESLEVQAINGQRGGSSNQFMGLPKLVADTKLYRIGHASAEGEVQTAPYSAIPTKEEQFMQIFKAQVQVSSIHQKSDKEVEWDMSDLEELNMYNMRREIEAAYLFGEKAYVRNELSKNWVYTCKGIVNQLLDKGRTIQVPTTFGNSDWVDLCKGIFVGNSGSSDRYMFVGSDLMAKLSKVESIERQIDANSSERIYGYTWNKVTSNFGTLHVYMHPMLDEFNMSNFGIVIDQQYLSKRVFRPLSRDILDLKKAGVFDGDATVLTEISSVVLKYPKCHALLYPQA